MRRGGERINFEKKTLLKQTAAGGRTDGRTDVIRFIRYCTRVFWPGGAIFHRSRVMGGGGEGVRLNLCPVFILFFFFFGTHSSRPISERRHTLFYFVVLQTRSSLVVVYVYGFTTTICFSQNVHVHNICNSHFKYTMYIYTQNNNIIIPNRPLSVVGIRIFTRRGRYMYIIRIYIIVYMYIWEMIYCIVRIRRRAHCSFYFFILAYYYMHVYVCVYTVYNIRTVRSAWRA